MKERRQQHLGIFAAAYGFTPADIDRMRLIDFEQLAAEADEWIKIKSGMLGGAA